MINVYWKYYMVIYSVLMFKAVSAKMQNLYFVNVVSISITWINGNARVCSLEPSAYNLSPRFTEESFLVTWLLLNLFEVEMFAKIECWFMYTNVWFRVTFYKICNRKNNCGFYVLINRFPQKGHIGDLLRKEVNPSK